MVEDAAKYFEDFLLRKEGKSNWVEYWVVLRGSWMLFYKDKSTTNRDNFKGSIELTPDTKCSTAKRRMYNFPFYISTARGTHLFKCQSNILRHQWLYVINLSAKRIPPVRPPSHIPPGSSTVVEDGEFYTSWGSETKQDDDDVSIPPGVILVLVLPDDMSRSAEDSTSTENSETKMASSSSRTEPTTTTTTTTELQATQYVPGRTVITTGIFGTSKLVLPDRNETQIRPHTSSSVDNSCRVANPFGSTSDLSRKTKFSGRWSPLFDRPNSSPQTDTSHKLLSVPPAYGKLNFSRHMVRSAPDIQVLSLEDS